MTIYRAATIVVLLLCFTQQLLALNLKLAGQKARSQRLYEKEVNLFKVESKLLKDENIVNPPER